MEILIVSPKPPADNSGNETTSARWSRLLTDLGHSVQVAYEYDEANDPSSIDLMVAMHAYKSAPAIRAYRADHPGGPLVVALTGTDLYKYRDEHPEVDTNIDRADAIVVLQKAALRELDAEARARAQVIPQSLGRLVDIPGLSEEADPADPPTDSLGPTDRLPDDACNVVFAAHLREVKDPLLTARAVRRLGDSSAIRVTHVGRALSEDWRGDAEEESRTNPRYEWHGEVPRPEALALIAEADLLTSTSRLEGGPNVVSEAIALETPVIATEIPGHVGLLGPEYPGYVPPGDADALAAALNRAESDSAFYRRLLEDCRRRIPEYRPESEREAWRRLLSSMQT